MIYYRVKSRVQMFNFDSETCLPLLKISSPELAFYKADVDRMAFGRLFLLFPPSGEEDTFSMYHILFSFSLKNMWISGNNIRVQMFYFDSYTTVPFQCVALVA